jgi:hypothetical protein
MIKKKKITGIAAATVMAMILSIGTTSVFASNNNGLKKDAAAKAQTSKAVVKRVQTHEDLVAIGTKLGINTAGMSDEQIEATLVAYKQSHQENTKPDGLTPHDHLIAVAAEVGINTAGMTDAQIESALVDYKLSHQNEAVKATDLQAIAKKMGITTTGMSDDQIKAAISEKGKILEKEPTRAELEAAAKTMGIDSTGMTDKQLGVAIKTAKVNLKK